MQQDSDADVAQQEEIRLVAYRFWQERGAPFGTPDVDWLQAENEVRHRSQLKEESPLVVAAKTVGAVVGSVAAMVAAVAGGTSKDT